MAIRCQALIDLKKPERLDRGRVPTWIYRCPECGVEHRVKCTAWIGVRRTEAGALVGVTPTVAPGAMLCGATMLSDPVFTYVGLRRGDGSPVVVVETQEGEGVEQRILDPAPSLRLWKHSPCGFEWGYCGSGPAQLALALLYDAQLRLGVPEPVAARVAHEKHQTFKLAVVSRLEREGWRMKVADLIDVVR